MVDTDTDELRRLRYEVAALRRERDSLARELQQRLGSVEAPRAPAAVPDDPPRKLRRVSVADAMPPRSPSIPAIPLTERQLAVVFAWTLAISAVVVLSWLL